MPGTSTIETKRKDRVLQVATSAEIVDLYGRLGLEQTASDLAHNACVCFDELGGGLSAAPAITREDIHDYYSSLLQDWLSSYTPLDTHLREAGVVQYPNYAVETDFSRFPTPIDLAGVFSLELRFETGLVAGWHPSVSEEHVEEATKAGTPVEGTVIGTQGIALTWRQVWGRLLEAYNRVNEAALLIEELRQAPADKQVQVLESLRDELGRAREEITELVVDVQTSMLLEISIGKISSAYDIVVRLIEEIVPSPEVTTLSLAETELGRLDNAFVALNQDLAYVMSQVMYVTLRVWHGWTDSHGQSGKDDS